MHVMKAAGKADLDMKNLRGLLDIQVGKVSQQLDIQAESEDGEYFNPLYTI